MPLPALPPLELRCLEDLSPPAPEGFLRLERRRLDLGGGEAFIHDTIVRRALDAVVIAAFYGDGEQRRVFLRSAIRPALQLRPASQCPFDERPNVGRQWELPAGLVEDDECSPEGLRRCAARELEEELGFVVDAGAFVPLGPASFPAAGVLGERHHFFELRVNPADRGVPSEDGSVLERDAIITDLLLTEALALVRAGVIEDAKTEIALRRLAEERGR